MKGDYDSEANALSIDLVDVSRWDDGVEIDDTYCNVALFQGRPVNVELLSPADHLELLDLVARRFALDSAALLATAQAALAAPDRVVTVTLDTASATA
jgi:hypothetical protein